MSPIRDGRLRAFVALMLPSFVGHAIQLLDEDRPWTELATRRYWVTPGWHLHLPPAVPAAIAIALVVAVIAVAIRRDRASFLALFGLYAAHYFTYPFRIRNHMTTMLFGLGVVALVWGVARASGADASRARTVDRFAAKGLAAVMTTQYFFAGLHKLNPVFTDASVESSSTAIAGLTTFWIYGDLGSVPPAWVRHLAAWGSIAIELTAAPLSWIAPRFAFVSVLVLLAFNVPIISALDIADYPMIASAFFPSLLTRGQWRMLSRHLGASRWTIAGGVLGGATQLWFMPWWGPMSVYGIAVLSLWGWAVGALAKLTYESARRRRGHG